MKMNWKRYLAFALALVMILGMVPVLNNQVQAATISGLSDTSIGLDGTANKWTVGSNSLTGSVTGAKIGSYYLTTSTTLTIKNNKTTAATLSFDFAVSGYFSGGYVEIDGTKYTSATTSSFSKELAAGSSITVKISADKASAQNTMTVAITNLSLVAAGNPTTTFQAPDYGSYTVTYTAKDAESATTETFTAGAAAKEITNDSTVSYTMAVTPGSGNKFVGWKNVTTGQYLSTDATFTTPFDTANTIKPIVVPSTTAVFLVGSNYFTDLDDAVTYATANSIKQITLVSSGTISDASYTIPAGYTLLIPKDTAYTPMGSSPDYSTGAATPYAFLTLTLAENTKITVSGTIEAEASHTVLAGANAQRPYGSRADGAYGAIYMSNGSNITLNSGATLYAWGYVYGSGASGEGTVTVNSGAKVYEYMQVTDFLGGSNLSGFVDTAPDTDADGDDNAENDYIKSFPFSQYYVQNVEVPMTLNSGATEYVYATIYVSSQAIGMPIEFIGSSGMFNPTSGSITKDYDPFTDRLIVDVDGNATVSSIVLDMGDNPLYAAIISAVIGSSKFDSSQYILGLNNNMTININSGTTKIAQDVALFPGVEVYVANGATLEVSEGASTNLTVYGTTGNNVYVYDLDQWGNRVFSNVQMAAVSYSPTSGRYKRTVSDLKDVKIDVNGTIITYGYLYTTVTMDEDTWTPISGGAAIISSGKTGKIEMRNGAGMEEFAYCLDGTSQVDDVVTIASAWLKNGDGTFLQTAGAEASTVYNYCATHDCWYTGECEKCNATVNVKWMNGTSELYNEDIQSGSVPTFTGTTPTKASDATNHYTFAGWTTVANGTTAQTLTAVTADTTYYAVFTAVKHSSATVEGGKHYCSCGYVIGSCADTTPEDHLCDIGGEEMTECADKLTATAEVPATCTTAGVKAYWTCSVCGKNYSDAAATTEIADLATWKTGDGKIAAMNHADANKDHVCDNGCGVYQGTHEDGSDADHLCDYCKQSVGEECHGGEATCTEQAVCEECGQPYGTKNSSNHASSEVTYKNITATTHDVYHKCCDTLKTANVTHTYDGTNHKCVCETVQMFTTIYRGEGDLSIDHNVAYGTALTEVEKYYNGITKTGYTFDGYEWYTDADLTQKYTGTTMPAQNLYLKVLWKANTYTVTWNVDGVETTSQQTYDAKLVLPTAPTKTGYTFTGWYTAAEDGTQVTAETVFQNANDNTVYYAQWEANTYTVTWTVDGATYDTTEVKYGEAITAPTPTKAAVKCTTYTFSSWKDAEGNAVPATMPAKDLTFEASFTEKTVHSETTKYGDITETTHDILCSVCDEVLTDNASHSYGTDGKCACGQIAAAAVISGETTVYYSTLNEAITSDTVTSSTTAETTVKLMRDIDQVGEQQISSGKFTLDLNGKTISIAGLSALHISGSDVDLTITSTAGGGAITNGLSFYTAIALKVDSGTVNIAGGTISAVGDVVQMQNGTLNISGGTVKGGVECGVRINGGTANISGGTIEGCSYAVSVNGGTANVSGGTIQDNRHGVYLAGGTANISGGTIECRDDGVYAYNGKVDITGGTISNTSTDSGDGAVEVWKATVSVTGGTIQGQVNDIVYGSNATGTVTLGVDKTTGVGATFPGGIEVSGTTLNAILAEGISYWQGNTQQAPADDATSITGGDVTVKTAKCTITLEFGGGIMDEQFKPYFVNAGVVFTDTGMVFPPTDYQTLCKLNGGFITREGYTLTGYVDQNGKSYEVDELITITSNMTFTAQWEVNEYTLTVKVLATDDTVELTVPYGANLLEVLAQAAADGKIPAKGAWIRAKDEWANGEYYIYGGYILIPSYNLVENNSTMPAEDVTVAQGVYTYGWSKVDTDGDTVDDSWQYNDPEKGQLREGWHYIEEDYDDVPSGAWYYFQHKGFSYVRVEGITRVPYNTELGYSPDQETLAYCESKGIAFIDATEAWFVFDENGKFQSNLTGMTEDNRWAVNGMIAWHPGLVEADDVYYYFIGDETNGGNTLANGDIYIQCNNTDHKAQVNEIYNFVDGKFSGYNGIVDGKYYEDSQLMLGKGLTKVGENYIYVRSTGYIVVDKDFWITANSHNIVPGMYHFDENGYLQGVQYTDKNGIFFEDGGYYYYVEGVRNYAGLIQYTGTADDGTVYENDWIYVRSNGQLATGEYWITKTNDNLDAKLYVFDETGAMIDTTGIIEENGSLYYYVGGILQQGAGLIQIDGNYYYVRTSGEVVNNTSYWITNVNDTGVIAGTYTFDENGVMQDPKFETTEEATTGIYDGYYYVDGKIAYGAGLVELEDGSIIYVRSNGQLATGKYWPTTLNGVLPAGMYDFGEDGILVTE